MDDFDADERPTWPRAFVLVMTNGTFWLGLFWAFVGASCIFNGGDHAR